MTLLHLWISKLTNVLVSYYIPINQIVNNYLRSFCNGSVTTAAGSVLTSFAHPRKKCGTDPHAPPSLRSCEKMRVPTGNGLLSPALPRSCLAGRVGVRGNR